MAVMEKNGVRRISLSQSHNKAMFEKLLEQDNALSPPFLLLILTKSVAGF